MTPASPQAANVPFREGLRVWVKVAIFSFGGPASQIAVMHRLLVEEKRWVSEERFLHALNYTMLLPGPEAQQLAVYIGWLLHGVPGGLVAGARAGEGKPVKLYARPHEILVRREANGEREDISARILHINPAGPLVKLEMQRKNGGLLQAEVPASVVQTQALEKGQDVLVRPKQTRVFD